MATSKSTKEQLLEDINAKREAQLEQVRDINNDLKQRLQASRIDSKKLTLLQSVSIGLYDEADKLSKKAPAETASDLMLEQVNDIIRETRELLQEDVHVQRLKEFVPAGNNPQLRDVVVVLRQIRQGMDRFRTKLTDFEGKASSLISQADTVILAIEYQLANEDAIEKKQVDDLLGYAPGSWFKYIMGDEVFNFEKFDRTNIAKYFEVE
jgi:hypothetical protein